MKLSAAPLLVLSIALAFAGMASSQVVNGVGPGDVDASSTAGGTDYDPSCAFAATLPLMAAPYMDPGSQAYYIDGEGAVLDECSGFGVSGYSPPNFLAYNCNARNSDGTRPRLPAEIRFSQPVSSVSIKVASAGSAGSRARLKAYNAAHVQVVARTRTLTTAAQTMRVTSLSNIRYVKITGPCFMIVDDLVVTP